jgi:hypothetical protein
MAIKRCPYCKAIIEEGLEYCSNCGTQLLFPDDEFIEEEIPGEKIVDEDVPEEDEPSGEIESEEEGLPPEETRAPTEKELEKEMPSAEEPAEEEVGPEESEPPEEEILEEATTEPEADEEAPVEEIPPEEYEEIAESPAKEPAAEEEPELKAEAPVEEEEEETGVRTEDVGKTADTVEKEKQEIDRFIESLRKERQGKEAESVKADEELPPWAAKMRESPPLEVFETEEEEKAEEALETEEEFPHEETEEPPSDQEIPPEDSGVGIPETVSQKDLPFMGKSELEEEEEGISFQPSSRFVSWIKSRAFDVLFIGVLWLLTLWIASRVMEVGLFRLIAASTSLVLGFYGILLVVYFFLFFVFLGETLGDHIFSQET